MFGLLLAAILFTVQAATQVQPGSISGRLLGSDGASAVAGVRIAAMPAEVDAKAGAPVLMGITQTDAAGRYRLENIPPGRYYIFAGLIDYPNYFPGVTRLDNAAAINVESGETIRDVDFAMARPARLKVAGRLLIPSTMLPLNSGTIMLTPGTLRALPATRLAALSTKVNTDGSFEFTDVLPGEYQLSTTVPGSSRVALKVADRDIEDISVSVTDCNQAGIPVSGRLVGTPVLPVRTIVLTGSAGVCGVITTAVNADGSFKWPSVIEGAYQVRIDPAPPGWSPMSLAVSRGMNEVEVRLPPTIQIKGHVSVSGGGPVPKLSTGSAMFFEAAGLGFQLSTAVRDDGTFAFHLGKGRYRIAVPVAPPGYYVRSMTYGSSELLREDLDVKEGESPDIFVSLGIARPDSNGVRVAGRVTLQRVNALRKPERVVLITSSSRRNTALLEAPVAADGSFEFSGVPSGTYNLETFPHSPAVLDGISVGRTDITGIEFPLPVLVDVTGHIDWIDQRGAAMSAAPANVSLQFSRKDESRLLAWATLAQSTDFHLYLPEGDYRFTVNDVPRDFTLSSATSEDVNILEEGLRVGARANSLHLRVILRER